MENALMATEILSNIGVFMLSLAVFWFVSVYKDK